MNTGHDGSLTTLHANSPYEVINRLVMMSRYAMDLPVSLIEEQIASALDVIVQLDRQPDGGRKVSMVCSCRLQEGRVRLEQLVRWDVETQRYVWSAVPEWLSDARNARLIDMEEVARWRRSLGL